MKAVTTNPIPSIYVCTQPIHFPIWLKGYVCPDFAAHQEPKPLEIGHRCWQCMRLSQSPSKPLLSPLTSLSPDLA